MSEQNRRQFLQSAAGLGLGTAALGPVGSVAGSRQIVHHVFFWLKNPQSTEDRNTLIEGVKGLAKIETVREIHVGVLAETEKRPVVDTSWQVSELIFFDDLAGQATYQNHPIHLEFVNKYSHLWEKVVVYDAREV